ncbi:MAG: rhomboid family intramembrane serine protease [Streptosporangiales bacterium]|nr:rhomboid family intramembrane serine protease [Streptosporangiales bacterium]
MGQDTTGRTRHWTDRAVGGLLVVGGSLAVLWAIEIVDTVLGGRLDGYGIHPLDVGGLQGLLFAPFLHAGFEHLIANSMSYAVLAFVAYLAVSAARFVAVIVLTALTSGFGAWMLTSPGTVVVGASGVIFGLLGFLLVRGIFVRSIGSIMISIAVLLLYGGMLTGIIPSTPYISWQAHLFGFVGGVLAAWLMRRRSGGANGYGVGR